MAIIRQYCFHGFIPIHQLIPFIGVGRYRLYQTIEETIAMLNDDKDSFAKEVWTNEDVSIPVPWTIIRTTSGMNLFFANNYFVSLF